MSRLPAKVQREHDALRRVAALAGEHTTIEVVCDEDPEYMADLFIRNHVGPHAHKSDRSAWIVQFGGRTIVFREKKLERGQAPVITTDGVVRG